MRPVIPVACGALVGADGAVLIARRPAGKIAAGKWEFPGGKIEAGETAHAALARELHEELGIDITAVRPLIRIRHDYSDRTVILDTWRVDAWRGDLHCREQQQVAWVMPQDLHSYDLLAADGPIVRALQLPADYVFTPEDMPPAEVQAQLARLPPGALLRLRLPALSDTDYEALAREVIDQRRDLRVMLDRTPEQVLRVNAAGLHLNAARAASFSARPLPASRLLPGSAHDRAECVKLRQLGADFAVAGPVLATRSHPHARPLGWVAFAGLLASANLPVYAMGGVGPAQHARAFEAYAQGTAGITAYWSG